MADEATPAGSLSPREAARFAERKRFSRFTAEDARLLVELRQVFEREAVRLVDAFYDHLLRQEELRPLLSDEQTVARLKVSQREYLLSLTAGTYDEAYAASRLLIGRTHERIGLLPQWYLGTYCLYLDLLLPQIHERFRADPERGMRAAGALVKLLVIDMQLALDAYHEARHRKAVQRSEQLAALGEMAASVAHEVRNPLAGMKGALEVLRKQMAANGDREILDEVLAQIGRLEGLVRDLLSFAQPDNGVRQTVDVHELLDRLLRYSKAAADEAAITVQRSYGPGAALMHADPRQLEQAFLNLIQNAIQAMDGGGTLTVVTRSHDGEMSIVFRDSGRGIAPDVLPQIFQPFFTTRHRGSGLGLSIVKRIVEHHGGTIEVESGSGRGTTATMTLPLPEDRRGA